MNIEDVIRYQYKNINISHFDGRIIGREIGKYYKKIFELRKEEGIYVLEILIWRYEINIDTKVIIKRTPKRIIEELNNNVQ